MRNFNDVEADIQRFIDWGAAREDVRAIILTSTFAIPDAPVDVLSDYDPILILTDITPYVEDRAWLGDFGPVLAAWQDPPGSQDGLTTSAYVTQYENGLKIDFTLWPVEMLRRLVDAPSLTPEFDAGYRVLLDKDHLTDGLKPPSFKGYIPTPPTQKQYLDLLESFFLDTAYFAKFLWRDDWVAAKHMLNHVMIQDGLRPVLEWHSEIEHGWAVKPGPYGRRLQRNLHPDLWDRLLSLYVGAGIDENWQALDDAVNLMRDAARDVGAALGYAYPDDLHNRCVAYFNKIKNLPPNADRFE